MAQNLHMLQNIQQIKSGNYRPCIPKKAITLESHKFKSLRKDSMAAERQQIFDDNQRMLQRVTNASSKISKKI